jgi:hypothetical protein
MTWRAISGRPWLKGSTQQWTILEDNLLRKLVEEHGQGRTRTRLGVRAGYESSWRFDGVGGLGVRPAGGLMGWEGWV